MPRTKRSNKDSGHKPGGDRRSSAAKTKLQKKEHLKRRVPTKCCAISDKGVFMLIFFSLYLHTFIESTPL
jgi:hypothetical protein